MVQTVAGLRRALRSELAALAIRENPESERSAVNPMFVIERLNDCFGESGWTADYKVAESNSKMVVVECLLRCWHPWVEPRPEKADIIRRAFGGNDNADRGDAYKGACTDALTKAASHLGIAHQVYKGLYNQQRPQIADVEAPKKDGRTFNQSQVRNFYAAVKETGKSQGEVDEFLASADVAAAGDLLKTSYESVMEWARGKKEAA